MKKILVALALVAFARTATAAISGGEHDLAAAGGNVIGACQYCHAPHLWTAANIGADLPLWNKNWTSTAYTFYTSNNITSTEITAVGDASKVCLTCHDGTTAMGAVVNGTSPAVAAMGSTSYAFIGTDLSDDHPVGIVYNTANALRTLTGTNIVNGMKVFPSGTDVTVECGSCHDPHGTNNGSEGGAAFLRTATGGFDMCTACHSK